MTLAGGDHIQGVGARRTEIKFKALINPPYFSGDHKKWVNRTSSVKETSTGVYTVNWYYDSKLVGLSY